MTPAKANQVIWAVGSTLLSVVGVLWVACCASDWYLLAFSICVPLIAFAVWTLLLCRWSFPEERPTRDLFHRTNRWADIKRSGQLFPTADASIYFVDSESDLSDVCSATPKITMVFVNAKDSKHVRPAISGPWSWRRFKMARGEWMATRYDKICLLRHHKADGQIIVDEYTFERVKGRQLCLLRFRAWAANTVLCVPLWLGLLCFLPYEITYHSKPHWYEYRTAWGFFTFLAVILVGYFLQDRYNKWVFGLE